MKVANHYRLLRRCVFLLVGLTMATTVFMLLFGGIERVGRLHQHIALSFHKWKKETWSSNHELMLLRMSEVETRMVERRRLLKQACAMMGLDVPGNDSLHRPNSWEFLVNRSHHLVWCNVFKAASTSWMYNFNILAGYSPKFLKYSNMMSISLARLQYPRPSLQTLQDALNDSIAFLIVRHPLERLLSAYRDKIRLSLLHRLYKKLGNYIILKYRKSDQKNKQVTHKSRSEPLHGPTFAEFVQYLVDADKKEEEFDEHWTPITQFCTPCQVDFDMILKFETLQEDQNYLIYRAGLRDIIRPEWKNHAIGHTSSKLVRRYYSQLTRNQILQLYHIYRYDFELFNYTLDGYLDVGMTESNTATTPIN